MKRKRALEEWRDAGARLHDENRLELLEELLEMVKRHVELRERALETSESCYVCHTEVSPIWRPHPLKSYPEADASKAEVYRAKFCNHCASVLGYNGHRRPHFFLSCSLSEREFLRTRWPAVYDKQEELRSEIRRSAEKGRKSSV